MDRLDAAAIVVPGVQMRVVERCTSTNSVLLNGPYSGARVRRRALAAGIAAARGRFVIVGDADDSYDFSGSALWIPDWRCAIRFPRAR